jgi:EAL domain-containing protein (putative c-di-GMP-specific phosphodiesterase class I)
VETNEQLAQLSVLGCNVIQGYLISRPLPASEVTTFLLQQEQQRKSA